MRSGTLSPSVGRSFREGFDACRTRFAAWKQEPERLAPGGPYSRRTISRLAHGAYHIADQAPDGWIADVLAACSRVPAGVVCLGSAAFFEVLVDEPPPLPWLAISGRATTAHNGWEHFQVLVPDEDADLEVGVIDDVVHGIPIRRTNAARTAVDLVRHASRVGGRRSGIEAIRRVIAVESSADPILAIARDLRMASDVQTGDQHPRAHEREDDRMMDVLASRRASGTGLPVPEARCELAERGLRFPRRACRKPDSSLLTGIPHLINRSTQCAIRLIFPSSRSPWKSRVRTHAHSSRLYAAPDR